MQTEEFGGEKERDGGRKGERKKERERESAPRTDVGVATLGAWKKEINGSGSCSTPPLKMFPYRLQCIPAFSPFSLFMKFRQSFLSFPFLYLSFIIYFSHNRERERELCVYLLDFPLSPSIQLSHAAAVSLSSLFIQPTPPSVTVQCGVYSSELELRSYNSLGCAAALCVCVGGVLAAAW